MIELRHLYQILMLAEKGTFRKAASELHISQPALTKSIQKAESFFDVRLFERTPNGVEPTTFGKVIAARASLLLRDADAITRDVRIMARLDGGELRVGIGPYIVEAIKGQVIGGFLKSGIGGTLFTI
jgi:DNA-binding transcriptional LysR family regulator